MKEKLEEKNERKHKIFSSIGYFSTLIQSVTEFKVIPQYLIA